MRKSGKKWFKVGNSGGKWRKVVGKLGKVGKVARCGYMWFYVSKSGWMRFGVGGGHSASVVQFAGLPISYDVLRR